MTDSELANKYGLYGFTEEDLQKYREFAAFHKTTIEKVFAVIAKSNRIFCAAGSEEEQVKALRDGLIAQGKWTPHDEEMYRQTFGLQNEG
jgi:hypothetical protein